MARSAICNVADWKLIFEIVANRDQEGRLTGKLAKDCSSWVCYLVCVPTSSMCKLSTSQFASHANNTAIRRCRMKTLVRTVGPHSMHVYQVRTATGCGNQLPARALSWQMFKSAVVIEISSMSH